ncbi:MAG: hypothetical protein WAX33_04915 [Rectinemataceae bacterium]
MMDIRKMFIRKQITPQEALIEIEVALLENKSRIGMAVPRGNNVFIDGCWYFYDLEELEAYAGELNGFKKELEAEIASMPKPEQASNSSDRTFPNSTVASAAPGVEPPISFHGNMKELAAFIDELEKTGKIDHPTDEQIAAHFSYNGKKAVNPGREPPISFRGSLKQLAAFIRNLEEEGNIDHPTDKQIADHFSCNGKPVNPESLKSIRSRDL